MPKIVLKWIESVGSSSREYTIKPADRLVLEDPPMELNLHEPADLRRLADALGYDILGGGA